MSVALISILLAIATPALPNSQTNLNRTAAGTLHGTVLRVALEVRQAMWYPDGGKGVAVPIQAFAEVGKAPQIPGPMIRVRAGTTIIASVRNSIPGTTLQLHGLLNRPALRDRAVRIPFGKTRVVRFRAGPPGTYYYWGATTGKPFGDRVGADSQLNGALIVDPPGVVADDRVFVVTVWDNVRLKNGQPDLNYELDAFNGRVWPYTERLSYKQGETVHWRVINASAGSHPLHLHGFYFGVDSRGDGIANTNYNDNDPDKQVTELVEPGNTFSVTWHADRPGNWFFHCHLAYHIIGHQPLEAMIAGKSVITDETYETKFVRHAGMGGLMIGFTVQQAANDPIATAPVSRHIHLRVEPGPDDAPNAPSFRYVVDGHYADPARRDSIGPPIVLTRGVPVAVDVTNFLTESTAVHWHGMELADSYYDGVSGYSGYGTHVAPMIMPGQTFEALMTPPRAGTFIYHTHMDDVWQLRAGLAGPLIVLEPGATYDPSTDHVYTITTTHPWADFLKILVNGTATPAAITVHTGVLQRFRFINMSTFWTNALVSLNDANRTVRWRPLALDGAYLPKRHQRPESAVHFLTIGETRDFTFVPTKPGELKLQFWPDPTVPNIITVPVHVVQ